MNGVATELYDLWFDPNSVGGDMVVECWISHGPGASDPDFAQLRVTGSCTARVMRPRSVPG